MHNRDNNASLSSLDYVYRNPHKFGKKIENNVQLTDEEGKL